MPYQQIPVKNVGKTLMVIVIFALIVTTGFEVTRHWDFIKNLLSTAKNNDQNSGEGFLTAVTDINLRANPSAKAPKVGLVPKDSVVKIISENKTGNWCEIIIQQYSRAKEDSGSLDRGWVNKSNLVSR